MGIPGLLPMLKEHMVYRSIGELGPCVIGVDGYSWLYKAASNYGVDLYYDPEDAKVVRKYVQFCVRKCRALMAHGIRLYFVFDGEEHPMKEETAKKRREKKEEVKRQIEALLSRGKKAEAKALMNRCVKVDRKMVENLVTELEELKIPHMVAPYEADPQLTYLEREGYVDYITTEDSDLIVYGARRVLFKLNELQGAELFDREKIMSSGGRDVRCLLEKTKEIAALSGCDYTEGIRKIGLITAHKLMLNHKSAEECINYLSKKDSGILGHLDKCTKVVCMFYFHVVQDPVTKERRHLTSLESSQEESGWSALEDISFVGSLTGTENEENALGRGELLKEIGVPLV